MEIEVGEFVRTKSGFIGKVIAMHGGYGLYYELNIKKEIQNNMMNGIVYEDNIVKHSKHIIDLIEVGDYVNGYKIVETYTDSKKEYEVWLGVVVSSKMIKEPLQEYFDSEMIKTILTHEQYEKNCYRLEE